MTMHTPGPWRIAKRGAKHIEIVGPHGGTIATIDGKLEAAAHLIASAPDLLAACESALPIVERALRHDVSALLRAAIAKAKG